MTKIRIKTPALQPYQADLYTNLMAHWEDTIHIVKSPRQYGKSFMIEMLLLSCSVNHSKQTSIVIEPTLSQSRKMAKELYSLVKDIPVFESYNSTLLELHFINGSEIIFKSNEQRDAIRGYTITKYGLLVVDEGAYCADDMFYSAMPLCNVNKAPILIFSTPRWKSGFFYEIYVKGEKNEKNIFSYDWSKYTNPFLTAEKLEMVKKTMSYNLFRADYLCQWMEENSDIFGDFKAVLSNDNLIFDNDYIASIDWGVGKSAKSKESDYTVISIFNTHRQQIYMSRWNNKNEIDTIKTIVDIIQKFKPKKTIVETNSIGSVFLGLLKKEIIAKNIHTQIMSISLTNDIKNEMYSEFILAVQNRTVQLLDNAEIKLEMSALQMQRTPSGKITYNASSGYKDDCLDTICYCLYGLKKGNYAVK